MAPDGEPGSRSNQPRPVLSRPVPRRSGVDEQSGDERLPGEPEQGDGRRGEQQLDDRRRDAAECGITGERPDGAERGPAEDVRDPAEDGESVALPVHGGEGDDRRGHGDDEHQPEDTHDLLGATRREEARGDRGGDPGQERAEQHAEDRGDHGEDGGQRRPRPGDHRRGREDGEDERRHRHERCHEQAGRQGAVGQPEERERPRIQLIVDTEDERKDDEPQDDGRSGQHEQVAGDLRIATAQRDETGAREHDDPHADRDREDEPDQSPGAAAERVERQLQFQSEKLCNHSIPSADLRPPASSTNRSSSVPVPRTSSTDPAASTLPCTMMAT